MIGVLAVSLAGCDDPAAPIVIGAVLPLSGSTGAVGTDIRDGMTLAIDGINAGGGVNGHPLHLVMQDGAGGEATAQAAFRALVSGEETPLVMVAGTSGVSMALKPLAEEEGAIPLFGLVVTAPALTEDVHWIYRYWSTAEQEMPIIASALTEDVRTLAVLYTDEPYGRSMLKQAESNLSGTGIQVTGRSFTLSTSDFSDIVAPALTADAIAAVGFAPHIMAILSALNAAEYDGVIVSTTTATLPEVVADPMAEGVYVVASAIYNKNYVFADEVRTHFEATFSRPLNQYAANGYDFIGMLAGLLADTSLDSSALTAKLRLGFMYSGLFGNVSLKTGAHDIAFPLFPARILNGQIVYR